MKLLQTLKQAGKTGNDTLTFPPAPCPELCRHKSIKRFHFSCLTCPVRRYYYKKKGFENYTRMNRVTMVINSASGQGFVIPRRYRTYGLIIPAGVSKWRLKFLKYLLTFAERIAQA